MSKVLIIEDEARMREITAKYFEKSGFTVYQADNGLTGLEIFNREDIDLVLLDVMMPMVDGFTVCKEIRSKSDALIIMLTARVEDDDKIKGFELGADEYVTKPFSPKVLVARAQALMNRATGNMGGENIVRAGKIIVNLSTYEVSVEETDIYLSPKEFDLLLLLMKNKNKVLTREIILDKVWGYDYYGDYRTVDTHIKKLRSKLQQGAEHIKTVIRVGYKFEVK